MNDKLNDLYWRMHRAVEDGETEFHVSQEELDVLASNSEVTGLEFQRTLEKARQTDLSNIRFGEITLIVDEGNGS